jgi:hypothetical protein
MVETGWSARIQPREEPHHQKVCGNNEGAKRAEQ